tara:strand:+ start:51 stop:785 length:735 start_codon:yes stop_codon:yes gene_type:complete
MSQQLVIFNSIVNFVKDLTECFGEKQVSLQLYNRLLEKTTVSHKEAISKHINIFTNWFKINKTSILEKNKNTLEENNITYSEKVYINLNEIFSKADNEQQSIIWQHILTICAYTNPDIKAKEILKQDNSNTSEKNFLQNMIDTVEENVGDNDNLDNPMQAVASMMSSGVFNDLVGSMTSGLQNGELDLSKLMGTVNTMVSSLTNEIQDEDGGDNEQLNDMMNNLTNLVDKMNVEGENLENKQNK